MQYKNYLYQPFILVQISRIGKGQSEKQTEGKAV